MLQDLISNVIIISFKQHYLYVNRLKRLFVWWRKVPICFILIHKIKFYIFLYAILVILTANNVCYVFLRVVKVTRGRNPFNY